VWDEALKLAGQDPDFHRKDLWTAIEGGQYPKWDFGIQTIPESQADDFDFDPLDATKIWPEEDFPVRYVGELELNRNVSIHTLAGCRCRLSSSFHCGLLSIVGRKANICILA
jgi:catalase